MAKASWNGRVIAESDRYELVEGNVYFPPQAVRSEFLTDSPTTTLCAWKGVARYYTLVVDGHSNVDAAWYYDDPLPAARHIKDHVAFWKDVKVEC